MKKLQEIGSKIRKTESWGKFKKYFRPILDGAYNHHCSQAHCNDDDGLCKNTIHEARQFIDSAIVKDHCELNEEGCKGYCNAYCDHFASPFVYMNWPPTNFRCPTQEANATDELLPRNEEIDLYLTNFLNGEDCSK